MCYVKQGNTLQLMSDFIWGYLFLIVYLLSIYLPGLLAKT